MSKMWPFSAQSLAACDCKEIRQYRYSVRLAAMMDPWAHQPNLRTSTHEHHRPCQQGGNHHSRLRADRLTGRNDRSPKATADRPSGLPGCLSRLAGDQLTERQGSLRAPLFCGCGLGMILVTGISARLWFFHSREFRPRVKKVLECKSECNLRALYLNGLL
jgi:hypothetical protein